MTTKTAWLAGTSFYDSKLFISCREFPKDMPLVLEREPTNAYDTNAVLVFLESKELPDSEGFPKSQERFKIGHVPAKDGTAAWLAPLMDAGKPVTAKFLRHGTGPGMQIEISVED